ncbi:UNVERIFIED_CONTAM: hypothetical protein HDU68_005439 [Siphonaria sp. JEL0065]|nr:hypothetical protein HDU68_005439 [Siphonaria sp. JEL0065]
MNLSHLSTQRHTVHQQEQELAYQMLDTAATYFVIPTDTQQKQQHMTPPVSQMSLSEQQVAFANASFPLLGMYDDAMYPSLDPEFSIDFMNAYLMESFVFDVCDFNNMNPMSVAGSPSMQESVADPALMFGSPFINETALQTFPATPISTPTISPATLEQQSVESEPTSCTESTASSSPPPQPKGKKMRFRATKSELEYLLKVFETNPFPSASQRQQVATRLKLEPKQVLFWFQNRRATLKTNGIVAVKPKKATGSTVAADGLEQLSADNPYFYVADKNAVL